MKANKKNICKKVMACGLALSMMAPVTSFAAVQQSSEITGDNTVENGIFNVVLPTEVTFAVDPMELLNKAEDGPNAETTPGTESNQIASTNLNIINQSNYAIRVDAYTSLKLNSDIKLKDVETDVKEDSTDKVMYLGIGSLTEAVPTKEPDSDVITLKTKYEIGKIKTPEATPAPGTDPEPQINQPVGKKPADTDSYKYDTKISCILDKVTYSDVDGVSTAADPAKENVGGFVFYGKVNSRAPWADGDITANIVFDVKGMSASEYTLAKVGQTKDDTANPPIPEIKPIVIENMANSVKPEKFVVPELPTASASVNDADKKTVLIEFTNKANSKATRVVSAKVFDADDVELGELPVGSFTSEYTTGKIKFIAGEGTLDSATLEDTYMTLLAEGNQIQVVFDDGMTMTPVEITAP